MNMMNFLLQYLTQLHSKYLGQGHNCVKVTVLVRGCDVNIAT